MKLKSLMSPRVRLACSPKASAKIKFHVDRSFAEKTAAVSYGSISYSQGGRSNDRDMSTAVLRAGSANALRGHRQCPGPCGPNDPSRSFRNLHGRFAEVRRHGRRLHTRRRPATLASR